MKRDITIKIIEKGGDQMQQSFVLTVDPRRGIIDHGFKFYEKENIPAQIVLPPLFNLQEAPKDLYSFLNKYICIRVVYIIILRNIILFLY